MGGEPGAGGLVGAHDLEEMSRADVADGPAVGSDGGALDAARDSFKGTAAAEAAAAAAAAADAQAVAGDVDDAGAAPLFAPHRDGDVRELELRLRRDELELRAREAQRLEDEVALKRAELAQREEDCAARRELQLVEQLRESAKTFFDRGMTDKGNKCMDKVLVLLKLCQGLFFFFCYSFLSFSKLTYSSHLLLNIHARPRVVRAGAFTELLSGCSPVQSTRLFSVTHRRRPRCTCRCRL